MVQLPDDITRRITRRISPILKDVLEGSQANVARARIRDAVAGVIAEMERDRQAALSAQHVRMTDRADERQFAAEDQLRIQQQQHLIDLEAAVKTQKEESAKECLLLRQADHISFQLQIDQAVSQTRVFERAAADKRVAEANTAAEAKRLQDIAAARAEEVVKADKRVADAVAARDAECVRLRAADATAAETKRVADIAAARRDERAKCVREIETAPVTGITVALTLFANSMRQQIRDYVAGGPR